MKICAPILGFCFYFSAFAFWEDTSLATRLKVAGDNSAEIKGFVAAAAESYDAFGEKAAVFLVKGMPERDLKVLTKDFLLENLALAMAVREQFPWAKSVPEDIFLNDVLPYASLDETRESWRKEFHRQCSDLVADCMTATEAVQAINREFFKIINVHYNTGRKAPNQSPAESKKLGMATCTGLSIILVDACRSVGIPARVAGTPLWSNKRGNHTWVEIYDNGKWYFTGADEYNKNGLNKAWFTGDASKAIADDWKHAIWATSWKKADGHFPMVWNLKDQSVAGVNVTSRYTKRGVAKKEPKAKTSTVFIRVWADKKNGNRLALPVVLINSKTGEKIQTVTSRAGTTDLNDMPSVTVKTGVNYRLQVVKDQEIRSLVLMVRSSGEVTKDLVWSELPEKN